jgi:hypothetical protein
LPEQTFIADIEIFQTNEATIPSRLLEATMSGIHAVEATVAPPYQRRRQIGAGVAQNASNEATISSKVPKVPMSRVEAVEAMMTAQGTIFNFPANY